MTSSDVDVPRTSHMPDGLGDINATDLTMPIYKIDHESGTWVDSLMNQEVPSIQGILLGVFKQRILWPEDPGASGETPICRCYNFVDTPGSAYDLGTGIPDEEKFKRKLVLTTSGFTAADVDTGQLSCADCKLKEWGSHPKGDGPWCNEQYTTPILVFNGDSEEDGLMPAVISHQRTALKPLKNYVTGFVGRQRPFYSAVTKIGITLQKKGNKDYGVPKFQLVRDSDSALWAEFSQQFAQIRSFLTTPRVRRDADESAEQAQPTPNRARPSRNVETAPEAQTVTDADVAEVADVLGETDVVAPVTRPRPAAPKAAAPKAPPVADDEEVPF